MLTKAVPIVATLLGAISCAAHATPIELGDADLDRIVASDGSGNGNGNIGSNNGNNNSGSNNGNNNSGSNNGNNNGGSNNGNNNASSGNGNNNSTDGNGNGTTDPTPAPEEVLKVDDVLRDMLTDILTFDDGGAVSDVVRTEVKLRLYKARLALARAEDKAARIERLERKIEKLAAEHAEAAAAAELKRRNGITRKDLDFVFFSGDDVPNPKRGLQRIVDRGFILYGHDASRFAKFSDRLQRVIFD